MLFFVMCSLFSLTAPSATQTMHRCGRWQGGQNKNKASSSSSSSSSPPSSSSQAASGFADLCLFEGETSRLLVCRGMGLDFYDNGRAGEKEVTDSNQVRRRETTMPPAPANRSHTTLPTLSLSPDLAQKPRARRTKDRNKKVF